MNVEMDNDCIRNPENIPEYFRDKDHLDFIVKEAQSDLNLSESGLSELYLVARCDYISALSSSLEDVSKEGFTDEILIRELKDHFCRRKD